MLNPDLKNDIIKMLEVGFPISYIARKFKCSTTHVRTVGILNNVQIRKDKNIIKKCKMMAEIELINKANGTNLKLEEVRL